MRLARRARHRSRLRAVDRTQPRSTVANGRPDRAARPAARPLGAGRQHECGHGGALAGEAPHVRPIGHLRADRPPRVSLNWPATAPCQRSGVSSASPPSLRWPPVSDGSRRSRTPAASGAGATCDIKRPRQRHGRSVRAAPGGVGIPPCRRTRRDGDPRKPFPGSLTLWLLWRRIRRVRALHGCRRARTCPGDDERGRCGVTIAAAVCGPAGGMHRVTIGIVSAAHAPQPRPCRCAPARPSGSAPPARARSATDVGTLAAPTARTYPHIHRHMRPLSSPDSELQPRRLPGVQHGYRSPRRPQGSPRHRTMSAAIVTIRAGRFPLGIVEAGQFVRYRHSAICRPIGLRVSLSYWPVAALANAQGWRALPPGAPIRSRLGQPRSSACGRLHAHAPGRSAGDWPRDLGIAATP